MDCFRPHEATAKGTFDPVQTLTTGPYGWPVAADLNGDGFDDLVTSGDGGLAIRYGGPAGLGPLIWLSGTSSSQQMDLGDLNADGRLDLVTGVDTTIVVRLATGATTYGPEIKSLTGVGAVQGVRLGDIDEDGKLDVLLLSASLAWMKGNGDGTFAPATPLPLGANGGLFLADLNGDHHLDAISADAWSPGDGHGGFAPPVPFESFITDVGDVTGDGAPDLLVNDPGNEATNAADLELWRNDGAGNFTRTWSQPLLDFGYPSFGDFNEDGRNDVLVSDALSGDLSIHLSNGDGTLGSARNYQAGNKPSGVVLAEVTGDGRLDAITSNSADGTVSVLPGLPAGQFGAPLNYAVGIGPSGIATGDMNGDGRADIVTADQGSNTVSTLLGQAGGGLGGAITSAGGTTPGAIALGDMDRDGHLDAVVVSRTTNKLTILKGNGSGGFALGPSYSSIGGQYESVAVGDLDGDPWPDVVVAEFNPTHGTGAVQVFRGDGAGGLLPGVIYGGGGRGAAIADVTGDGIPDIISCNQVAAFVLKGTGGGAFSLISPGSHATQGRTVAVADRNQDGKPDLLVAADWANCVWSLNGLGGGAFGVAEGYGTERSPTGIAVADLDGDGTLDVVTSDADTSLVTVLMGIAPGPVPALATLVSAEATGSGVRIEWLTGLTNSLVIVERSESGGSWTSVGQIVPDASGQLTFTDPNVKPGSDYIYRLGFDRGGATVYAGLVSVHVPVSASLSLAPGSNPALGSFSVAFALPDSRPARLELYDVSGRRVLAREVGAMGPGTHVIRLGETSQLASGVYWLRLVHPDRTLVARAALVH